jgi:hypothetical protein
VPKDSKQRHHDKIDLLDGLRSFSNSGPSSSLIKSLQEGKVFSLKIAEAIERSVRQNIKAYELDDFEAEKTRYPIVKRLGVDFINEIEGTATIKGADDLKTALDVKFPGFTQQQKSVNIFITERCERFPARQRWRDQGRTLRIVCAIGQALEDQGMDLSDHKKEFAFAITVVFNKLVLNPKKADPRKRLIPRALKALEKRKKQIEELSQIRSLMSKSPKHVNRTAKWRRIRGLHSRLM